MKVYVMSADRRQGISKKTNMEYNSIVCDVVYKIGMKYAVKQLWIDPNLLQGVVPQYGDVLEISVDFGGYVQAVNFLDNIKFALNERTINKQ